MLSNPRLNERQLLRIAHGSVKFETIGAKVSKAFWGMRRLRLKTIPMHNTHNSIAILDEYATMFIKIQLNLFVPTKFLLLPIAECLLQ